MDMESSLTNWKQGDNIAWKIKVRNLKLIFYVFESF